MTNDTPRRGGGPQKIYDALKADILNMTLAPGAGLDETELSARFGMSRTPVREALQRLVAEGLATTLPNRNTVVTVLDFDGVPHYLDALTLMYRVTGRLAALRRTPEDLERMRAAQADFAAAVAASDAIAMLESNRNFHLAIARAGGNRYYADLFERLLNDGMRLLRLYYRSYQDALPQEFVHEHDAMIAVIEAGDAAAAERQGAEHASQIVGQLQRFIAPALGADIGLAPEG
ncbi:GntR family transcriptional regulator [Azospirillum sp.]|uniref:GntR family transcriptional regulator n=1 Tax=Azospirillum sp. TaxID=34012 RepID=UPI00261A1C45|nr:GntR family transcriptional regulator [Azospirillum sp.]